MRTIFVILVLSPKVFSIKWPGAIKKCDPKANDFDECFKKSVQFAYGLTKNPIREFGFPTLDPLNIATMTISAGTKAVAVEQKYSNVKIHGFSEEIFEKVHFDFETKNYYVKGLAPHLSFLGNYDFNGKILLVPIIGNGPCAINMYNATVVHSVDFEEYEKNGSKHFKVVGWKFSITPQKVSLNFENLFNGDKALGDNINKILNENWKDLYSEVRDGYEKSFGAAHSEVVNRFFGKIPIDEMFGSK